MKPLIEKRTPSLLARYEARMKPARKKIVKREFQEWLEDMGYDPKQIPEILKAYIFEAFVGGWGAKARISKRKRLNGKNQD